VSVHASRDLLFGTQWSVSRRKKQSKAERSEIAILRKRKYLANLKEGNVRTETTNVFVDLQQDAVLFEEVVPLAVGVGIQRLQAQRVKDTADQCRSALTQCRRKACLELMPRLFT